MEEEATGATLTPVQQCQLEVVARVREWIDAELPVALSRSGTVKIEIHIKAQDNSRDVKASIQSYFDSIPK